MKSIFFPPFFRSAVIVWLLSTSAHAAVLYDLSTAQIGGGSQNTWAASSTNAGGKNGTFSGTLPTNLKFANGDATQGAFDYFTGTFASTALANVGDTITLSFTFTTNKISLTTAQALRFGLFNVGSATTGSETPAANSFRTATGYRVDYGPLDNTSNGIRERTFTSSNLFNSGISPLLSGQNYQDFTFKFLDNTTYSGSFKLELLTGSQVKITAEIGGNAYSLTDTASAFTTFNAFSFYITNTSVGSPDYQASLDFTALTVTIVPEPATWGLALGGFTLALVGFRRRHNPSSAV